MGDEVGLALAEHVRCAARTRRSFTASTITHSSATTATPAAASATMPWVVRQLVHAARLRRRSALTG